MKKAMQKLLDLGHKDIVFIGGTEEHYSMILKEKIWRKNLIEAGIDPDPLNIVKIHESDTDRAIQHTEEALAKFFDTGRHPTAYNDYSRSGTSRLSSPTSCREKVEIICLRDGIKLFIISVYLE